MKKLTVFLLTGILAGMSFTGCGLLDPEDDEDEVTITLTTFSSIEADIILMVICMIWGALSCLVGPVESGLI